MNVSLRLAIWSGIAAGAAMLAFLMVGAGYCGLGWDSPLRWVLGLVGSEPALIWAGHSRGGVSVTTYIIVGLFIHFATAICLARLFLTFGMRLRGVYLPMAAVAYAITIWAIMTFAFLGVFNQVMDARIRLIPLTFFTAHLIYGGTLVGAYSVLRPPDRG